MTRLFPDGLDTSSRDCNETRFPSYSASLSTNSLDWGTKLSCPSVATVSPPPYLDSSCTNSLDRRGTKLSLSLPVGTIRPSAAPSLAKTISSSSGAMTRLFPDWLDTSSRDCNETRLPSYSASLSTNSLDWKGTSKLSRPSVEGSSSSFNTPSFVDNILLSPAGTTW